MTIDVGLTIPRDRLADQKTRTAATWFAIIGVFLAAILLRQILPFNVDVSWWLIVSERMLDGQRLYLDILETNPPMAVSVYLLGVTLARAIHVRSEIATDGLIFLLIAGSLAVTWRILRNTSLRARAADGALATWTVMLLSILPMYDFGQREHLALIVMLPALGVYILRGNHERVSSVAVVVAGLSAAITMSFKPYFAGAVGFSILAAATQARDWRVLFAFENWIAAGLVLAYGICTIIFYPEYFTVIYPLVRDVYLLLKAPMIAILLTSATALWIGAAVIVLAIQKQRRKIDGASSILLAGSFGFAISFFVQGKGWGYHAYPMVALGSLAAGWAIMAPDHDRLAPRRLRAAASFALAAMFANACLWFNASVDVRKLEEQVARLGPNPTILVLSAAAVIGHPMVRTLHGTWISRQEAFWVREIVRRSQANGTIDTETAERLGVYVARERAGLIEDFTKQPPDVVLVDNQESDWGNWAHADPEISALLRSYTPVQTIDGVDILRRMSVPRF